nr:metal ABC transporter permease [Lachnospiraceae bacterium]
MLSGFFQYDFMKNVVLAILIITPLFALLGTMIVTRKMAFFSDALGHSALTGIAVGVVFGMQDTDISMVIFAVVFALLLNHISEKMKGSTDTIISVFASCSTAIGLAILSKGGNFSKYSSLLVGDILSITGKEIVYLAVIFVITFLFWI